MNDTVIIELYKNGNRLEKKKKPDISDNVKPVKEKEVLKNKKDDGNKSKKEENQEQKITKTPKTKPENNGDNKKEVKAKDDTERVGLFDKLRKMFKPENKNKKSQ